MPQHPFTAADNIEEQECVPDTWDPVQMQIFCNKYFFQENKILKSFTLLCKPNEVHTSKELNQQSQGIVKDQHEWFLSNILVYNETWCRSFGEEIIWKQTQNSELGEGGGAWDPPRAPNYH